MRLIEKNLESEFNGDWRPVDDAPEFDTPDQARDWLIERGALFLDNYRLI